jgi:hypothetical protein
VEPDQWEELASGPGPEGAEARRSSVGRTQLELVRPDTVLTRNLFNLVKKALLPRDAAFNVFNTVSSKKRELHCISYFFRG